MSNNYLAIKLDQKINKVVLEYAAKYSIDLNSVQLWTPNMYIVGEERTGNFLHVRNIHLGVSICAYNHSGQQTDYTVIKKVAL